MSVDMNVYPLVKRTLPSAGAGRAGLMVSIQKTGHET